MSKPLFTVWKQLTYKKEKKAAEKKKVHTTYRPVVSFRQSHASLPTSDSPLPAPVTSWIHYSRHRELLHSSTLNLKPVFAKILPTIDSLFFLPDRLHWLFTGTVSIGFSFFITFCWTSYPGSSCARLSWLSASFWVHVIVICCIQCFDAVGWAAGRASGL